MTATVAAAARSVAVEQPGEKQPGGNRRFRWMLWVADRSLIYVLTGVITVIAHFVITALEVPRYILPTPWEVALVFKSQFYSRLAPDIVATMTELLIGLVCGLMLGLVVGALIAESNVARKLLGPYVVALVSTPMIVFAPLLAIWFGFGLLSKVVMVILMTFGPMAVNTIQGFSALDNDKYELMRSLVANRWEMAMKARFPVALPYLFSGMKISAVLSVIAVVVAEFIGSQKGLGHTVYYAQTISQTDLLIASALILVVIGLTLFYSIDWLSRKVVYWQ